MHVVLFDIDGTLILSGGAGKAALELALVSDFGITEVRDGIAFSGRTDRAIIADLLRTHLVEDHPENWERLIAAYLRHLPATLAASAGQVLPGVEALLRSLHARDDVRLGLLTGNIREGARLKLGHFGLFDYFPFGGFGDRHTDRDEVAREALAEVRRLAGNLDPSRSWVIGDTPLDIRCARAIGARALAVCTGWHPEEELAAADPDLLLCDLSDPAGLLAELI
jgi:phosphoglycolate phosphatase